MFLWRNSSFRTKLLGALLIVTLTVTITILGMIWFHLRDLPTQVVRSLLLAKLAQADPLISRDDLRDLEAHYDTRSPAFQRLAQRLQLITDAGADNDGFGRSIRYGVYLFAPTSRPGIARQLVTLTPAETGLDYDMRAQPAVLQGWNALTVEPQPTADAYGLTLSGFLPIRDPPNPPGPTNSPAPAIALLGIDVTAHDIAVNRAALWTTLATGAAVAMAGSALCAFLLARLLNKPVALLHGGMTRVAEGDLTTALPAPRGRDEFAALIPQFNRMVEGLRERRDLKASLETAAQIQGHLLPRSAPAIASFDLFAGADYCDETGGDYFDFIPLADGAIGLVVADVAGHGIASALVMAGARGVLRSCADGAAADPGALLRIVNRHLCQDVDTQKFVTLFYGVLDPASGAVTWSSAGHEEGILLRVTGDVEVLGTTGMPLGIDPYEPYPTHGPLMLAPGDLLAVATDGIRECRNAAGEFFDGERLIDLLRRLRHRPATEIHAEILKAVHAFRTPAVPQQDDISLLVLRALPTPSTP